jgi:quercetin dioxygenase-like cupin family protein
MLIRGATREWPPEPGQVDCFSKDLVTSAETGAMSAHHLRIEPGGLFKCHAHDRETELHFMISGYGRAQLGDSWVDMKPGDVVLTLPGVPHAFQNNTSEPIFVLCVFSPPLY